MFDASATDFLPFPSFDAGQPVFPAPQAAPSPRKREAAFPGTGGNAASPAPPAPAAEAALPAPAVPGCAEEQRRAALAEVLRHPGVWRRGSTRRIDAQPTGFDSLDALLPGGWPRGALSEILLEHDGLGECSLLLPTLAALTRAGRRVVLVAPPHQPHPPALAAAGVDLAHVVQIEADAGDTHWTAEQCLRAGCCGAVLNWLPRSDYRELRRLQLAAEAGDTLGFVFRPLAAAREASPAALRLKILAGEHGPRIEVLKCRGLGATAAAGLRLRA